METDKIGKLEENALLIASQLPLIFQILYALDLDTMRLTVGVQADIVSRKNTIGFLFEKPFDLAPKLAIEEARLKRIKAAYELCKVLHETDEVLRESREQLEENDNPNPFN